MMRKLLAGALVTLLFTAGVCLQAEAQLVDSGFGRGAANRPKVSPYLDLLNNGNNNGIGYNYYRRVQPEMQLRSAQMQTARSVEQLRARVDRQSGVIPGSAESQIPGTGHPTAFMNYGSYFMSNSNRRR